MVEFFDDDGDVDGIELGRIGSDGVDSLFVGLALGVFCFPFISFVQTSMLSYPHPVFMVHSSCSSLMVHNRAPS